MTYPIMFYENRPHFPESFWETLKVIEKTNQYIDKIITEGVPALPIERLV